MKRLTGSANNSAENIELSQLRRSEATSTPPGLPDKGTRVGMTQGITNLLKHLETAMGLEDATRAGEVQKFLYEKLQRRNQHTMAEWVNAFDKTMLDIVEQKCPVAETSTGWFLFEKAI